MNEIEIYHVKPGDTLLSIGESVNMTEDELTIFHNTHCAEVGLSWFASFFGVQKIVIPKRSFSIQENFFEKKQFRNHEILHGVYKVVQNSFIDDKQTSSYGQTIKIENIHTSNPDSILFTASEFRKNGDISDSKISEISTRIVASIYPLIITFSKLGKIEKVKSLNSEKEIQNAIDLIKEDFEDDYSKEIIEKNKMNLLNSDLLYKSFLNTNIAYFLSDSLQTIHKIIDKKSSPYQENIPCIFNASPIKFEIQNTVLPSESSENKLVKIKKEGICIDNRSSDELFFTDNDSSDDQQVNQNPVDCEFSAEFSYQEENLSLLKIETTFLHFIEENVEKEIFFLEKIADY